MNATKVLQFSATLSINTRHLQQMCPLVESAGSLPSSHGNLPGQALSYLSAKVIY